MVFSVSAFFCAAVLLFVLFSPSVSETTPAFSPAPALLIEQSFSVGLSDGTSGTPAVDGWPPLCSDGTYNCLNNGES